MVTTLCIDGMRSVHCARAVHTSLARIDGIAAAEVVVGRATIEHHSPLDEGVLTAAVEEMGYTLREVVTDRRRLVMHDRPEASGESSGSVSRPSPTSRTSNSP